MEENKNESLNPQNEPVAESAPEVVAEPAPKCCKCKLCCLPKNALIALIVVAALVITFVVMAFAGVFASKPTVDLFSQGLLAVENKDGKWGYIAKDGSVKIDYVYDKASPFSEHGVAVVCLNEEYYLINKKNKKMGASYQVINDDAFFYGRDLAPVQNANKKWGFINSKGEETIACQYDEIALFNEKGYARIGIKGDNGTKYGVINEKGETVLAAQYNSVTVYEDLDIFATYQYDEAQQKEVAALVNKKGEQIQTPAGPYKGYGSTAIDGLISVRIENANGESLYGFVNKKGEQVIPCDYYDVKTFKGSLCGVKNKDGKWGYINKKNELVVGYQFEKVLPFVDGIAAVKKTVGENELWGYINKKGETVIEFQYDDADNFNAYDWAVVEKDGKQSVINRKGEALFAGNFLQISPYALDGKSFTVTDTENNVKIVNRKGEVLRASTEDTRFAYAFADGYTLVYHSDGISSIEKDGEILCNKQFSDVSFDSSAIMELEQNSHWQ